MFDFCFQMDARQSMYEERLRRALARAERERPWAKTPQPAAYRQVLVRVGAALVTTGTWLQHSASPKPTVQFDPVRNR